MKEIFQDYVRNAFDGEVQAQHKFKQFGLNYQSYFPSNKDAQLLDVGIGRGEMLSCMQSWGYQNYHGIDISPSTVKFCSEIGLNCQLVEDSADYLFENENSFDVVTVIDVLEHIKKENVIFFLKALKSSLKLGGVAIIQLPNLQAPDGQLHRYNDITHEVGYIEHSLAQVLMVAGFDDFFFKGFEEFVLGTLRERVKKTFRWLHWLFVRFCREVDGNINPKILHPVFCAVVKKND
ncbi:MAG: class I SAM-dependent methyltransferase [Geopsychrobacter sp.]|nr:class I SAM-dependent methyltransferase [Geopsychrobacter sp.]